MGKLLYDISLRSFYLGIKIASFFNDKADLWIKGRKDWKTRLVQAVEKLEKQRKNVWFHVSSLGEFEQGRPVMEELKKNNDINLIISFYSPSGYEVMKDWKVADLICYLPLDTANNAKDFIKIINPVLVVFVKYEFWYHFLEQVKKSRIPSILISARFYPSQSFFKSWLPWYRKLIFLFDNILVQDQVSLDLLNSISYLNTQITGDTRYDRVVKLSQNEDIFTEIESFIGEKKTFIAGSSWPLDEKIMIPFIKDDKRDVRFILVPHDVNKDHVLSLQKKLAGKAILHSEIDKLEGQTTLIIDRIGMLSRLYKYAYISYIGGAFKEGLHNILEPAAYGIPVITGPDHSGFPEGPEMENNGGLFKVKDQDDFKQIINRLLEDEEFYLKASEANRSLISNKKGASEKTISILERYLK